MMETSDKTNEANAPAAPVIAQRRGRFSLVWLVPLVAAAIGLSMLLHAWLSAGPEITIHFRTATGLEAGKTPVKYKDVTVGAVSAINLSDDGSNVMVKVSLVKSAESLIREDTRFWVVRPRIGMGGVSGIDTLLSGAYIGVDRGESSVSAREFTGLETPPSIVKDMPGTTFILRSEDLGSLDIGSPIYYRRIQVGRVASYELEPDGRNVKLQIFVDAPYDKLVTVDTRFWNASGVDVSLGAEGLKLKTQSVATIVAGGVAFASPVRGSKESAPQNTVYVLAKDQEAALAPPDGQPQYMQLRFEQSLRGLSIGAPVQFSGVDLGRVVSMNLDYDPVKRRFPTVVGIVTYPDRLGRVLEKLPKMDGDNERQAARFLSVMVEHGLRAQARAGNLLTGQLYISLDFVPNAPKVAFDVNARPLTLPTINGGFDKMQEQIASIVAKVEKMPLDAIGANLNRTLAGLDQTLAQINREVLPETSRTMQQAQQTLGSMQGALGDDAPLQQNLGLTLQEVQRAARSLRTLTDLLGRHPESLLRGRPADPASTTTSAPAPTHPASSTPQEETRQ